MTGACCVLMVVFPSRSLMDSARKGISLWASSVSAGAAAFFHLREFPAEHRRDTDISDRAAFPFLMSVLVGLSHGCKDRGRSAPRAARSRVGEAKRLMSFCSTSGPAFHRRCSWDRVCWDLVFWAVSLRRLIIWGLAVNGMVYTAVF